MLQVLHVTKCSLFALIQLSYLQTCSLSRGLRVVLNGVMPQCRALAFQLSTCIYMGPLEQLGWWLLSQLQPMLAMETPGEIIV